MSRGQRVRPPAEKDVRGHIQDFNTETRLIARDCDLFGLDVDEHRPRGLSLGPAKRGKRSNIHKNVSSIPEGKCDIIHPGPGADAWVEKAGEW